MSLFIAKLISNLTNPLMFSFPAAYLLVYAVSHDTWYAFKWGIASFAVAAIISIFVILGVKKGVFSDFDVSKRKQRNLLFTLILLVLFFYILFLLTFNGPKMLILTTFAALVSIFIMGIINIWIKASIHIATVAAFFVTLSIIYGGIYIFGLLFIPLAIWSRIKTKRHTPLEAVSGVFLGTFLTFIVYIIIKRMSL